MPSAVPRAESANFQSDPFMDTRTVPQVAITIESDQDEAQAESPTQARPSAKKRSLNNGASAACTPQKKARKMADIPQYTPKPAVGRVVGPAKRFSLPEIREIINAAYVGLPGQIDPRVSERMSKISMGHWDGLLTRFLDITRSMCEQLTLERVVESFSSFRQTPLYDAVVHACGVFLNRVMEEQRVAARRSLSRELHKAMTLDEEGMIQAGNNALADLRAHRLQNRLTLLVNEQEAQTCKGTSGQARKDKIAKMTADNLDPDPFDQEIVAMAVSLPIS